MNTLSSTLIRVSAAVAVAAALSTTAHAAYRCAAPEQLGNAEATACKLAKEDSPEALVHYVQRSHAVFSDLSVNDYVTEADAKRWEIAAAQKSGSPAVAAAKTPAVALNVASGK